MNTAARPIEQQSAHWYTKTGEPCYSVPLANGTGMRSTTLADARQLNLLPSVTTILKVLHKPALETWKQEQLGLALMTTPRIAGETDDQFVFRVIHTERQHEQERDAAAKRGTDLHKGIQDHFQGRFVDPEVWPWIEPCVMWLQEYGSYEWSEQIVIGDGYAGKYDLQQYSRIKGSTIWDFKTTKKLPKEAYPEHKLQLAAYAEPIKEIETVGNIYISTVEQGKFVVCEHEEEWIYTYRHGFKPLLDYWCWANDFHP